MSGEGKRLCKKECYEVYASRVFRIVKVWWLCWTGYVAWMETWNFVVGSRLEDSAEDKSVILKWILGKYAVMVYNIDKTFLGYQLHREVGWWSKPTFWESLWFHDDGNIDGFWNATLLHLLFSNMMWLLAWEGLVHYCEFVFGRSLWLQFWEYWPFGLCVTFTFWTKILTRGLLYTDDVKDLHTWFFIKTENL